MKYVYEGGCYRLYADNMLLGIIKKYIADYDEELVKMSKVNEVLLHITTDLTYVSQDALNADEDIINFQNGILKITATDTELIPHSADILSTIQLPCEWSDEYIDTPVFDSYMDTLTNGDEMVKQLLMEFIGVCISNVKGWRMKKALFLVGQGDTGKSQLKSLVERLLGRGNFIGIDLKEIESRFGTGAVYGTRLAGSSDMSFLPVDELKTFKKMTGGDSLFAEFKGQQAFEFTFNGLLWFCMNRLPKFGGDDGKWVYDRIMVVDCPNVIPKEQQDKQLLEKMYAERRGIVKKAVKALQTVIANGYRFTEPDSIAEARRDYQSANSTVISFYEECMCPWENGKIVRHCTTGRIYKVYQAWCRENNHGYARTAKEFREQLAGYLGGTFADVTTRQNSAIKMDAINHRLDSTYQTPFAVKEAGFNIIDALFGIIGRIMLKNLIKIFPIDKTYDGDKWDCKDYFFTMNVLKEKGLDNAVGRDGVFDLMWDYMNKDLREFTVFFMSCMSAMYKKQTGVGIAEKFCEDNGIGSYTMNRENGLLIDNQSGEIAKVSNNPSFMQIVK